MWSIIVTRSFILRNEILSLNSVVFVNVTSGCVCVIVRVCARLSEWVSVFVRAHVRTRV